MRSTLLRRMLQLHMHMHMREICSCRFNGGVSLPPRSFPAGQTLVPPPQPSEPPADGWDAAPTVSAMAKGRVVVRPRRTAGKRRKGALLPLRDTTQRERGAKCEIRWSTFIGWWFSFFSDVNNFTYYRDKGKLPGHNERSSCHSLHLHLSSGITRPSLLASVRSRCFAGTVTLKIKGYADRFMVGLDRYVCDIGGCLCSAPAPAPAPACTCLARAQGITRSRRRGSRPDEANDPPFSLVPAFRFEPNACLQ
jgi:hypothetical protein